MEPAEKFDTPRAGDRAEGTTPAEAKLRKDEAMEAYKTAYKQAVADDPKSVQGFPNPSKPGQNFDPEAVLAQLRSRVGGLQAVPGQDLTGGLRNPPKAAPQPSPHPTTDDGPFPARSSDDPKSKTSSSRPQPPTPPSGVAIPKAAPQPAPTATATAVKEPVGVNEDVPVTEKGDRPEPARGKPRS